MAQTRNTSCHTWGEGKPVSSLLPERGWDAPAAHSLEDPGGPGLGAGVGRRPTVWRLLVILLSQIEA